MINLFVGIMLFASIHVGSPYTDCTGNSPVVPVYDAHQWTCVQNNNLYYLGHNPGVFSPITHLQTGDAIVVNGQIYFVDWVKIVNPNDVWVTEGLPYPSLTLQTCENGIQNRFIVRAHEGFPLLSHT